MKGKCPLCKSDKIKPFLKRKERDLVKCGACDLVFVSPFPSPKQVRKIYTEAEFFQRVPYDSTKAGYGNYLQEEALIRERFRKKIALIKKHQTNGKLLDVGCATGFFLSEARKAGYEVYGVDLMKFAVDHCRKSGLKNVYQGTLEETKFPNGFFDVVVAMEILEHLANPKRFLKKVAQLIKPSGLLVVSVPNRKSLIARLMGRLWFGYYQYQHLLMFEPKTITSLLSQSGFVVVKIEGGGVYWGLMDLVLERIKFYYSPRVGRIVEMFKKTLSLLGIRKIPLPTGGILLFLVPKQR